MAALGGEYTQLKRQVQYRGVMGVIVTARQELAIRRNLGDEGKQLYKGRAIAPLRWRSPYPWLFIGGYDRVIQPLAIRRKNREVVSLSGCQLFWIAPVHIDSPCVVGTGHPARGKNDMAHVLGNGGNLIHARV